jgi:hypothetical protein
MRSIVITLLTILCFAGLSRSQAARADQPETVMVTLYPKPGADVELARVIADHWKTANQLKLVNATPHVTLRGTDESKKTYFVEIFTWRDNSIPDNAPAAIQNIWSQMNALVENQPGRPGLAFTEVSVEN